MSDPLFMPLQELTKERYGAWRQHPVTQLVMQYLANRVEAIDGNVLRGWAAGEIKLVDEQVFRGQRMAFDHVATMSSDDIKAFYGLAPDEAVQPQQPSQPETTPEPKEDDGIEIDE